MANSYLSRTPSSAGNRKTWTWSGWVKFSQTPGPAGAILFSAYADGNNNFKISYGDTNQVSMRFYNGSEYQLVPNRKFRDFSSWYHFVFAVDTTLATAGDRFKIYVNGVRETSFQNEDQPSQDLQMTINDTTTMQIGRYSTGSNFFDGYMSHVSLVDGQALTPTSFGETDSTSGIWKFKSPSGLSWGTNGFHLKFESSGNLGLDSSGQTNNFTVNGNLKQALDTPTNNHATFNPIDKGKAGAMNFANGNTTTMNTSGFGDYGVRSSLGVTKGKWYWEVKIGSNTSQNAFGILPMEDTLIFDMYGSTPEAHLYGLQRSSSSVTNFFGNTTFTSGNSAWGGGITSSDVVGFALDMDNGKLYISKNGTFKDLSGNTSNIGSGTYPTFTIADTNFTYALYVEMRTNDDNGLHINMGNGFFGTTAISSAGSNGNGSLFEYDVPSGFYALNTKNLNTYG